MKSSPTPPRRATATPSPIAKVVNPLGTVVTVHSDEEADVPPPHEDIVIYENCDETLFRPMVTPKSMPYVRSSKADSGNIMTQSLRGDTNVTVRVMDKPEGGVSVPTNWEDPRVQDIGNDTKVIVHEGAVKDLLQQGQCKVATAQEKSKPKKVSKSKKSAENLEPKMEDSSYGLLNPLYSVLEECERLKSKKKENVTESKPEELVAKPSNKKHKNKKVIQPEVSEDTTDAAPVFPKAEILPEYIKEIEKELDNEVSFTMSKPPVLKQLESVEELAFPALDSKLLSNHSDFPPLEENFFSLENLAKPEKFEDAEDCGLPLDPFFDKEPSKLCSELLTEDNPGDSQEKKKSTVKKPTTRKPKTKLGVKIGTLSKEDSPEPVEAEITLPVPKRSWSSIAATKPMEPPQIQSSKSNPWNNNEDDPVAEIYTVTLPSKKSYSSVTTEKLLDIDSPDERCEDTSPTPGDHILDERLSSSLDKSPDFLKLSDKSSDDEKVESGSSPIETTESSDEGKVVGVVDEFDTKDNVTSLSSKPSAKRRVRKKKK